jgi:hypothetical protein
MEALAPCLQQRIMLWYPQCHTSTYFASHRVNGSGHPLDKRLEGYCQGHVPQVPWATGYGSKTLNTVYFPPTANGWGTKYPVLDIAPPLLSEEDGPPN